MGEWETTDDLRKRVNLYKREWANRAPKRVRPLKYKKWRAKNPETAKTSIRKWNLQAHYQMSPQDYEALYISQNGLCAICLHPPPEGKLLTVDHNHETSKPRGLLCSRCNAGLGQFLENSNNLHSAIRYLEKWT